LAAGTKSQMKAIYSNEPLLAIAPIKQGFSLADHWNWQSDYVA
jgi:hypothetical protein